MHEFLQETVEDNMTRRVRSVGPETTVGEIMSADITAIDGKNYPDVMRVMERTALRQYPSAVSFQAA